MHLAWINAAWELSGKELGKLIGKEIQRFLNLNTIPFSEKQCQLLDIKDEFMYIGDGNKYRIEYTAEDAINTALDHLEQLCTECNIKTDL